jgi:hypothetical protein
MKKTPGRVLLCIELGLDPHPEGAAWIVVSLPGREGTLSHSWRCPSGRPNPEQLEDIGARMHKIVIDALMLSGVGIQAQLLT